MNVSDIQKYAALLLKIFNLEEQFRKNPPSNPTAYIDAIGQIKTLYDEAYVLIKASAPTPADIAAAHARNQSVWNDPKPPQTAPQVPSPPVTGPITGGPTTVTGDPMTTEYNTVDEAIAAAQAQGQGYGAYLKSNGKYHIAPVTFGFGNQGTKVWPEPEAGSTPVPSPTPAPGTRRP